MSTMSGKLDRKVPTPATESEEHQRAEQEALIDFESEQSFPASDPPSWTFGPDKESSRA